MKTVYVFLLLAAAGTVVPASSQEDAKFAFHVTAVSSKEVPNLCDDGKCSGTKITVEGYSKSGANSNKTQYVLECTEIISNNPAPHVATVCDRVHANLNYLARFVGANAVAFGEVREHKEGQPVVMAYEIVSEREGPP